MKADPLELALRHILAINKALKTPEGKAVKPKGVRSRLRSLPSLILDSSPSTALLIYTSKAADLDEKKALMETLEILKGKRGVYSSDAVKALKEEGKGYGVTLGLVLNALEEMGELQENLPTSEQGLIEYMLDILKNWRSGHREFRIQAVLMPYLTALKRAAEALWGETSV